MLIDHAKIYVYGGKGGNGCNSLFKDIFHRRGIPDGGDGGDGGNVVIESDPNLQTLLDFKYKQHYRADKGKHGGSNRKNGRTGEDLLVKVPVGTIIKDAGTDLVLRDLAVAGERVIVAKGGPRGKGSAHIEGATPGEDGESKELILELKLVADCGIIGFPNAGKSTLVSRISKAHTKIADYPFTTKSPKLGIVTVDEDTFVVADMPGLIEGAHSGKGLGVRFLRHIERTRVLVHLVDISPLDGSDPADNYSKLEKELELYGEGVSGKPRIVVANKMDMPDSEGNLKDLKAKLGRDVLAISALDGTGLKELIYKIYNTVKYVKEEDKENND
ncbi:MAG: GTPase ObgE [Candidatus Omnitrophota bacterium]